MWCSLLSPDASTAGLPARRQAWIAAGAREAIGLPLGQAGQADEAIQTLAAALGAFDLFILAEDEGFERVLAITADVFVHWHGATSVCRLPWFARRGTSLPVPRLLWTSQVRFFL